MSTWTQDGEDKINELIKQGHSREVAAVIVEREKEKNLRAEFLALVCERTSTKKKRGRK